MSFLRTLNVFKFTFVRFENLFISQAKGTWLEDNFIEQKMLLSKVDLKLLLEVASALDGPLLLC